MSTQAAEAIREEILSLVERYHAESGRAGMAWQTGPSELASLVAAVLSGGDAVDRPAPVAGRFERELARLFGTREALLVPSGSAANHLALAALTSTRMGRLQVKAGGEVITVAVGTPSLVAAIGSQRLKAIYVDIALPSFTADVGRLQTALSSRTRALALPHLYGNPCDLDAVTMFASFHNLLLVEDCRQAAGASFAGRAVGCFGQFASLSFAPGRQLEAGGGGALLASTPLHRSIAESMARSGVSPMMVAALGLARLAGFPGAVALRTQRAALILADLASLGEYLVLPEPLRAATPSWSALPFAVRESAPFTRAQLLDALSAAGLEVAPMAAAAEAPATLRNTHFLARQGWVLALDRGGDAQQIAAAIRRSVASLTEAI